MVPIQPPNRLYLALKSRIGTSRREPVWTLHWIPLLFWRSRYSFFCFCFFFVLQFLQIRSNADACQLFINLQYKQHLLQKVNNIDTFLKRHRHICNQLYFVSLIQIDYILLFDTSTNYNILYLNKSRNVTNIAGLLVNYYTFNVTMSHEA